MVQAPGAAFTSVLLPLVPVSTFLRERRPNRVARYLRAGLQYLDTRKRAPERTRVTTSISCQGYSQAQIFKLSAVFMSRRGERRNSGARSMTECFRMHNDPIGVLNNEGTDDENLSSLAQDRVSPLNGASRL